MLNIVIFFILCVAMPLQGMYDVEMHKTKKKDCSTGRYGVKNPQTTRGNKKRKKTGNAPEKDINQRIWDFFLNTNKTSLYSSDEESD